MLTEPNHRCRNICLMNGSQMVKMNITIQLDDSDISLTDLLSAILHKEHVPVEDVPVVKVEEPTPQNRKRKHLQRSRGRNLRLVRIRITFVESAAQLNHHNGGKLNRPKRTYVQHLSYA